MQDGINFNVKNLFPFFSFIAVFLFPEPHFSSLPYLLSSYHCLPSHRSGKFKEAPSPRPAFCIRRSRNCGSIRLLWSSWTPSVITHTTKSLMKPMGLMLQQTDLALATLVKPILRANWIHFLHSSASWCHKRDPVKTNISISTNTCINVRPLSFTVTLMFIRGVALVTGS